MKFPTEVNFDVLWCSTRSFVCSKLSDMMHYYELSTQRLMAFLLFDYCKLLCIDQPCITVVPSKR
jgi:hypothetical protein